MKHADLVGVQRTDDGRIQVNIDGQLADATLDDQAALRLASSLRTMVFDDDEKTYVDEGDDGKLWLMCGLCALELHRIEADITLDDLNAAERRHDCEDGCE